MNLALKQRLVGASVLVALAVIFLPMLLDGSGRPERVDVSMDIPEEPQTSGGTTTAATSAEPEASTGAVSGGEALGDGDGATRDTAETANTGTAGGTQAAEAEPADTGEQTASTGAQGGDDPEGDSETAGSGAAGASSEGPSAWVVQVGSFARETNALVLRDKLRERGFEAFADQGRADGRQVWRVRVGPEATREEVEALKQRILDARGEPALIMSYPD